MFFGMTNSLATFQTMINNIFWDLIVESIMIVYLNVILIFTLTLKEHHWAVQRVLKVLAEHKLFLHLKKCKFDKQQIEYLRLVIAQDQVEIDLVKVAEICDWPILYNHTDLQIFLSFANFYQKFIHSFWT